MTLETQPRTVPAIPSADPKALRIAAASEAEISAKDAAAQRAIRTREAAFALEQQRRDLDDARRETARVRRLQARNARKHDKKAHSLARRAAVRAFLNSVTGYIRANMVAVYCSVVYGTSVAVAVIGQISMAQARGWPILVGVGIAVFVEGIALSMALTGHEMRMAGERALVPRILTWAAALLAASVNYAAHASSDPVLAVVFAASSLAGITVWEVRSAAKHRTELRRLKMIPEPPTRFGIRRWLRYPVSTFRAWSLDIHQRAGDNASRLLTVVAAAPGRRARRRQLKLDKIAARHGAPIIKATVIITERGPDDPWSLPPSIEAAGLRRSADTIQTTPEQAAGPVRVVRPEPVKRRPAPGPKRGPLGPGELMTRVFTEKVAAGSIPTHIELRDAAQAELGISVDVSYARRLQERLVAELTREQREELQEGAR